MYMYIVSQKSRHPGNWANKTTQSGEKQRKIKNQQIEKRKRQKI